MSVYDLRDSYDNSLGGIYDNVSHNSCIWMREDGPLGRWILIVVFMAN